VDISEEGTEPDRRSSDKTVDGESEWGDGVTYFETITRTNILLYTAFDNFFTSYHLLKTMDERGLYAVGTVGGGRKGLPVILKRKDRMQRRELVFQGKE
jgi:hypothetical protein